MSRLADLPGSRELEQTTRWVPSNSGIPHRGLTTPMPLGCVDPHWSTESLGRGEPLLGLGKGQSEVWVQKGVSHRALLEFLNLLPCFHFPGRRMGIAEKV